MSVDNGSDSCPSDDNLDMKELYTAIYLEKNKMAQAMQLRQAAEGDYDRNFANFVKKVFFLRSMLSLYWLSLSSSRHSTVINSNPLCAH